MKEFGAFVNHGWDGERLEICDSNNMMDFSILISEDL